MKLLFLSFADSKSSMSYRKSVKRFEILPRNSNETLIEPILYIYFIWEYEQMAILDPKNKSVSSLSRGITSRHEECGKF